ncbi:MAG: LemA family protein [Cyclobacteriaceae bacterium]|nr:LemA family protein [Cyclobacteriaceae bacterium]
MVRLILLLIIAAAVLYFIVAYNGFVKLKNLVEEGWSGIDVQLKKRYNLIPNLVNTVKGYATHEKEVFENVAAMRSTGINAQSVKEQAQAENMLTQALGRLFAVAENYPDLKANQNFTSLQNELSQIEKDIEMSRRYYNGTVRQNNIKIESFPSNLVANMFGFKKFDFFELDEPEARIVPKVDFS